MNIFWQLCVQFERTRKELQGVLTSTQIYSYSYTGWSYKYFSLSESLSHFKRIFISQHEAQMKAINEIKLPDGWAEKVKKILFNSVSSTIFLEWPYFVISVQCWQWDLKIFDTVKQGTAFSNFRNIRLWQRNWTTSNALCSHFHSHPRTTYSPHPNNRIHPLTLSFLVELIFN